MFESLSYSELLMIVTGMCLLILLIGDIYGYIQLKKTMKDRQLYARFFYYLYSIYDKRDKEDLLTLFRIYTNKTTLRGIETDWIELEYKLKTNLTLIIDKDRKEAIIYFIDKVFPKN